MQLNTITPARVAGGAAVMAALFASMLMAAPANAAANSADGLQQDCWTEVDTGRALCASSPDALADAMYSTYGVTLGERAGEHLPSSITAPGERAKAKLGNSSRSGTGAITPKVSYLLVRGYTERNYKGVSMTWSQSLGEPPCRHIASLPYGQYEYLYAQNWNDTMSSYQVAQGCKLTVWEHAVFRGTKRGPYGDSPDLGILNKKVSSMSLRKES